MFGHVGLAGAQSKGGKQINLFDEHSSNGTSVNGVPVPPGRKRPCVVKLGSVIKFGEASMTPDSRCIFMQTNTLMSQLQQTLVV